MHMLIVVADAHWAISPGLFVFYARLIFTADSRSERLRVLLSASIMPICIARIYLFQSSLLLSIVLCLHYLSVKAFLVFLHFEHSFAVTACTHSNMSLNLGGFGPPAPPCLHPCITATWIMVNLASPYYTQVLECVEITHACLNADKHDRFSG